MTTWPQRTDRYPRPVPDSAGSADTAAISSAPWEPPSPLGAADQPPPFPTSTLPGWLAEYVRAEATATQTPPDLAGMMVLAALATAAAGLARVQLRPGWQEPLNLFLAVAMPPGSRKSAVVADTTRPLGRFDRDEAKRMAGIIVQEATLKRVAEREAEQAQAAAGKAAEGERDALLSDAIAAAERAAAIQVAPTPRMLADDATPEALASLLAEHGRISLLSPEGGVFDMMAGRYQSNGPNLDVYLKSHAGDTIRIDRKGRPPEFVDRPALTVGLAVQPEVLRVLKDQPGFRGRGLLARFLYALPPDNVGRRKIGAAPVPAEVADRYRVELQALARSLLDEAEAAHLADSDEPLILTLDQDATTRLLVFEAEVEPRLAADQGDLGHVAGWGSKLVGAVARIAGLLHLAEHLRTGWSAPISRDTVEAAITLGRYLTDHALAAFGLMGSDQLLDDARYVLGWIERTTTEQITRRDLFTALPRGRFPKVDDLDPALALLEGHGYIRRVEQPKPKGAGRPPSPIYEVNPQWERER